MAPVVGRNYCSALSPAEANRQDARDLHNVSLPSHMTILYLKTNL